MTSLTDVRAIYLGESGTIESGLATITWMETTPDDWANVTRVWDETRVHVTHRHRIPVDTELLRSTELETQIVKHRRQRALSNALHTISNQSIRIGSVYTRTTPNSHRTERETLHTALLQQINARLEGDGEFGILFTTTELPPSPKLGLHRILETATPPSTSAGAQMANIIAWAAHQHLTHHDQPNFCWDLYQDLRHLDIYGEPLTLDTESDWVDPNLAISNCTR
ncbi:hypothetical protein [Rhodococcus sp. WY5]|uniref:hypothetical protein n=1 Tax=Rhodococcus sp. WY5 TaxID=2708349 RepID=UPI001BDEE611|nr:hypothetical protein [Rhodococcus sp. WY5]